jgi:NDP-sugar pyrophosphorylase family protein
MGDTDEYLANLQVVMLAGGTGQRLKHRCKDIPKPLLKVDDQTLLDYAVNLYKRAGCRNFVFLLGHHGDKVREYIESNHLVDNPRFYVERTKLGKGGAIKNAIKEGLIDTAKPFMITYPDDLILDSEFPRKLVETHLHGVAQGCHATVVRVDKTRYRYGWVKADDNGVVTHFEEKPWVDYPANVGIFVFDPDIVQFFDKYVDMDRLPIDFEDSVVPELVKEKLLFTYTIPVEFWIPVNEEKEFILAEKALNKS